MNSRQRTRICLHLRRCARKSSRSNALRILRDVCQRNFPACSTACSERRSFFKHQYYQHVMASIPGCGIVRRSVPRAPYGPVAEEARRPADIKAISVRTVGSRRPWQWNGESVLPRSRSNSISTRPVVPGARYSPGLLVGVVAGRAVGHGQGRDVHCIDCEQFHDPLWPGGN